MRELGVSQVQKFWALAVFSGLVVTAASSGAIVLAGVPVAGPVATRGVAGKAMIA